jgi:hypothetical protein
MSLNTFFYIKEKSLPISLTNKIIEVYNTLCTSTNMNESNISQIIGILSHTKNEKKMNEQYTFLLKLKQILEKELRNHFYSYVLEISSQNNVEYHKTDEFNINFEKNDYIITNRKQNTKEIEIEKTICIINEAYYAQLCKYIWFLTDYNGEIQICNIKLSPKKGTLIIYPLSWICPVIEIINKRTDIYVLYGYIQTNIQK